MFTSKPKVTSSCLRKRVSYHGVCAKLKTTWMQKYSRKMLVEPSIKLQNPPGCSETSCSSESLGYFKTIVYDERRIIDESPFESPKTVLHHRYDADSPKNFQHALNDDTLSSIPNQKLYKMSKVSRTSSFPCVRESISKDLRRAIDQPKIEITRELT